MEQDSVPIDIPPFRKPKPKPVSRFDTLRKISKDLSSTYGRWSASKKLTVFIVLFCVFGGIVGVIIWAVKSQAKSSSSSAGGQ